MEYLKMLYTSLEKYDNFLGATRDSDEDEYPGIWCITDTGEDMSNRFGDSPDFWPFDYTPILNNIPMDSAFFEAN